MDIKKEDLRTTNAIVQIDASIVGLASMSLAIVWKMLVFIQMRGLKLASINL